MGRLILAAGIMVVAVLVAALLSRCDHSRQRAESRSVDGDLPAGLGHLPSVVNVVELAAAGLVPPPDTAFIVVFTEATCRTCAAALATARGPLAVGLAVIEVEYAAQRELQRRLKIDTVPTTVVVDSTGAVLFGWAGKIDDDELAAAACTVTGRY